MLACICGGTFELLIVGALSGAATIDLESLMNYRPNSMMTEQEISETQARRPWCVLP